MLTLQKAQMGTKGFKKLKITKGRKQKRLQNESYQMSKLNSI